MAKDMTGGPFGRRAQRGFTLVELLVAATVLAIGILGMAMLQAMSLKAARGGANTTAAALLAQQIMDRAEIEGRLSWLNITDSNRANPSLADLNGFGLRYITIPNGEKLEEDYDIRGGAAGPAGGGADIPFYRASIRRTAAPSAGGAGSVGRMSDICVRVEFSDGTDSEGKKTKRTFSLTRRIVHG